MFANDALIGMGVFGSCEVDVAPIALGHPSIVPVYEWEYFFLVRNIS